MAVFTPVSRAELIGFVERYDVGELVAYEGIDSGIENTNYFVDTEQGQWVLTVFERLAPDQLPFYLDLMHHLADREVPCPNPLPACNGSSLGQIAGKPAALVTRLPGRAQMQPDPAHCAAVGEVLARMHLAAESYAGSQRNLRGLAWWREVVPALLPRIPVRGRGLLEEEMAVQSTFASSAAYRQLPGSVIHADLFRDNVLFSENDGKPVVGGVIDFYFAGLDTWVFDLAVTVNDWCTHDSDCSFNHDRLNALLGAYQSVRPVTRAEQAAWPYALRAAALRFWVSRLHDAFAPRPAEMITPKNPAHFEQMLMSRRQDGVTAGQALTASLPANNR
ncbi:MAG: homoserine kinase [Burkholderiaceae bacterium]